MYNIVQNGECVITWISGLPAIFARLVGTLLRWCYLKKTSFIWRFGQRVPNKQNSQNQYKNNLNYNPYRQFHSNVLDMISFN